MELTDHLNIIPCVQLCHMIVMHVSCPTCYIISKSFNFSCYVSTPIYTVKLAISPIFHENWIGWENFENRQKQFEWKFEWVVWTPVPVAHAYIQVLLRLLDFFDPESKYRSCYAGFFFCKLYKINRQIEILPNSTQK